MTVDVHEYSIVDIETMPNLGLLDKLPDPEVKYGNTKDPDKMQEKYEAAVAKQIEKMALNPMYGRICCVTVAKDANIQTFVEDVSVDVENPDDIERQLLTDVFKLIQEDDAPKMCTWNGMGFDVPYLYKRALLLDVRHIIQHPLYYWMKRYSHDPHCDMMKIWADWKSGNEGYVKIDDVSRMMFDEGKKDFDVTLIKDYVKTEEGRVALKRYCEQDVIILQDIFVSCAGVLF
jgi:DNA polymerase elongation subunit (family B)